MFALRVRIHIVYITRMKQKRLSGRTSARSTAKGSSPATATSPGGEIVLYQAAGGRVGIDVRLEHETVRLTQAQMADLFRRERSVITKHIQNVFAERELIRKSNVQNLHTANSDKPVAFYSLDVIISVGYRVKSKQGTRDQSDRGMTSAEIGAMLGTNPVVVRRTMAGLRAKGYVSSEKGHGGGWRLARPLEQLTLLDIYEAIGEPVMFAMGLAEDHPQCLVVSAVNNTLNDTLNEARQLILKRFEGVTIADIAAGVEKRRGAHMAISKIGSRRK